ncbi:MAG: sensor signal transduction histidine kinase [Deinococcus sp.]|nr:sensor signal transduction histidine kinase [Deinococcus sp.]
MARSSHPPRRYSLGAFDALLTQVAILAADGEILEVNQAWTTFAQESGGSDNVGSNYLSICDAAQGPEQADGQATAAGIRAVLAGQQPVFELEYPCDTPDQRRFFVVRVTRFEQNDQRLAMVAHEDITRRKLAELEVAALNRTLEERVSQRTAELEFSQAALSHLNARLEQSQKALEEKNQALEDSNRDLAQFAFVASHDLQEPLRTIGVYADVLRHRYQGTLDARAEGYLNHIGEQVSRARHLVRDVLALARVSVQPEVQPLELEPLWADITAELPWPAGAQWFCGALPPVLAHEGQLRQLLTNLLSNAIRFRSPLPLVVRLQAQLVGDQVHFSLQDNGIGVAPEHTEQVFIMFQRLHSRSETGGNGIGLALCKKIVERHGGRIWLESSGRGGTAVHFTLKAAPP